ncbi:N-acetylneuraminate synthase family protein [Desulfofustis glycolicus]|uniref:N-acetylneuraminate synthase n=1 Tax=Desulfofustis glycolicus DSM 9705 TaxID=1121409 RepID=A0A1M5YL15_9BACT|nr:N-acetylneuraminate synthase family protein [Desulfofustis glycolicus]MCB2214757.1 N-acetylneuraminate synthase family protein [Desulfobulbaceae bacterium]SHI12609.1 N-acetylneuraminate synthase [Desulfofustis glycolicus DSM 9705]
MTRKFSINGKKIGPNQPTYVIAEIGINHNGDEQAAIKLVDAAIDAGADAVKFQKRDLPSIYPQEVLDHPERFEQGFQYMIPILKEVELSDDAFIRIKAYCDLRNITFVCTPFDPVSADFLNSLDTKAFKIASADLTNSALLEQVAAFKKPMIVSTGMSTWAEIDQAVKTLIKAEASFALLHCRSVYPVWPREVNLRMINRLKQYNVPVGYSGHEIGITIALVAASMGAEVIEKHITLNKKDKGPDHKVSLEPYELKRLIRDIRLADQAIGKEKRFMLRGEVLNREIFGKSLVATRTLYPGEVISEKCVTIKGPGKGLPPDRKGELLGKTAKRTIKESTLFKEDDINDTQSSGFDTSKLGNWGLIARFSDYQAFLPYKPKVIEFHLAEKDFQIPFAPHRHLDCQLVVHVPEYLGDKLFDLCSNNEQIRLASIALVDKSVSLTLEIAKHFNGIPRIIMHPGAMSLQAKLDKRKLRENLDMSLAEIRKKWASEAITFLLENLPPYPWYFGGQWKGNYFMESEEICEFCSRNDVSICFDLSHAALFCNARNQSLKEMVYTLLPFASHLHLADGYGLDGEGVQFGEGDIAMDEILPMLAGFQGTWVPEIWRGHLDNGKGFVRALEYIVDSGYLKV